MKLCESIIINNSSNSADSRQWP